MSVRTTLSLSDRMTGTLQKMMRAMNSTIRVMEQMHDTSSKSMDMRSLQRARRDIENANASFERLKASARIAGDEGQNAGNRLRNSFRGTSAGAEAATSSVNRLTNSLKGFIATYLSIQAIRHGFSAFTQSADNYNNANARLANINDGTQTQLELQDKIYNAAQRSLSVYNDMASSVAKLNLLAKDAFVSNDEAIRFSELMNKAFSVSGAGAQEKQAGMHQLTQAMASGRLQGDEYVSIIENAPLLAQAIADSMGVSMAEMKKLSSEGKITADVIKGALFGAAEDIENRFSKMPMTFADAMTVFKNWAQTAFEPLFLRFSQFVNSDAFGVLAGHAMFFVNVFVAGMGLIFDILEAFYNWVALVGQFFVDNWSWIAPILLVIGVVLGSIVAILMTKYAILGLISVATKTWAAMQWVVNAAYLGSPITWILIGIIAIIALIIYAVTAWGEQTATVLGYVYAAFAGLGVGIWNILLWVANIAIAVVEWIVNTWNQGIYLIQLAWIALNLAIRIILDAIGNGAIDAAEWIANTFNNAVYAVQMAFYTMATIVMRIVGGVADGTYNVINKVLGAISDLINGAIAGVNTFIGLLNGVLDTDISTIGTVDLKMGPGATNFANSFQKLIEAPTRPDKVVLDRMNTAGDYINSVNMPTAPEKVSLNRFEYADVGEAMMNAYDYAYDGTMALSDSLNGLVDKAKGLVGFGEDGMTKENPFSDTAALMDSIANMSPTNSGSPTAPGTPAGAAEKGLNNGKLKGGKLDSIGRIEDSLNLADEYIEIFRDIAEGKAIENIISLTPNLQVHNTIEDTAGSVLNQVLNKMGDLSGLQKDGSRLNDLVSSALTASTSNLMLDPTILMMPTSTNRDADSIAVNRDQIGVPQMVREKVSAAPITNNDNRNTVVQHIKSDPKIEFSGDIHKDVDLEELVKLIIQWLKDEQNRSVEGIYE